MSHIDKRGIRTEALRRRRAQIDRDRTSALILTRLTALPEFCDANQVAWYIDVRDEVRTRPHLHRRLAAGESVIVPFCRGDDLRLCRINHTEELAIGAFGIQEPLAALQDDTTRQVDPATLDLVVVPGVAFDRSGRRLGHGFGFYDRLLARVAEATKLTAIAFECQMFDILPHEPHDVTVDVVVTESNVYRR